MKASSIDEIQHVPFVDNRQPGSRIPRLLDHDLLDTCSWYLEVSGWFRVDSFTWFFDLPSDSVVV